MSHFQAQCQWEMIGCPECTISVEDLLSPQAMEVLMNHQRTEYGGCSCKSPDFQVGDRFSLHVLTALVEALTERSSPTRQGGQA